MSVKSYLRIVSCLLVPALGVLSLCAVLAPCPVQGAEWPSLGGSYDRSGMSPNEGLAEGVTEWAQETGGTVLSSVTIGSNGQVYAACEDGKLYVFGASGTALWVLDVNSPMLSAPSIGGDGSLFVGCKDGMLRAIDPNGAVRWTFGSS